MPLQNNKSLGQHWLKNRDILNTIADLAAGDKSTTATLCLEIGPGLGTLTSSLLKKFDRVIAVEYDEKLATNLPKSFPGTNLQVVHDDFMSYDLSTIPAPYVVAGNIPYYITSPIIDKLLTTDNPPERIVLLIQKEVAERIADERETFLSIRCKNRADITLGPVVKRDEFTPPPKVDSQIIILTPHPPIVDDKILAFIKTGFKEPRKKVTHNLSTYMPRDCVKNLFIKNNINIDIRPAEIHLKDWQKIYKILQNTSQT